LQVAYAVRYPEVVDPAVGYLSQFLQPIFHADSPISVGHTPYLFLQPLLGTLMYPYPRFPFTSVKGESQKFTALWFIYRAFALVYLELQFGFQIFLHAFVHALSGSLAFNV
jgi:hypothetical protein